MIQEVKDFITSIDPDANVIQLFTHKQLVTQLDYCQGQHSKLFANSIDKLINIISSYLSELNNIEKYEYFEMVTTSFEVCPSVLRKNTQRVQRVYSLMCQIMANIKDQICELWYRPPEDFAQDDLEKLQLYDPDTALVCKFRALMDRLSSVVDYSKMLGIIQMQAISFYKDGDWRWKNAVLMTLSQLSENIQLSQIGNIMNLVNMGFKDSHPKVRFAAVQVLGQFSDDLKPGFQQKYFHQLMPVIIQGFEDDIQRVASHWMACMTNFIQDYADASEIRQYTGPIINKVCQFVQKGNNTSKQNAVSALSSLVTVPSLFDKQTISKPFQICHSIMQTFSPTKNKQLINQTFECITIAIASQPYHLVKQYISFTTQIIIQMSTAIDSDYLVAGWHRLCTLEQRLDNWKVCFTKVFQSIKSMENHKIGLNSILSTTDCYKEQFYPFAIDVLTHLQDVLSNFISGYEQQTTTAAIDAIEQIMNKSKPINPDQNWDNMVKKFVIEYSAKIVPIIQDQQYKIAQKLLDAIKELLSGYAVIFNDQMANIYQFSMQVGSKLHQKKLKIVNDQVDLGEEIDQDLLEEKKQQDLEGINSCTLCIPDIVREVVKNCVSPQILINQILIHVSNLITNAIDDQDFRYATYYMDNLLQDFDYEALKAYWSKMYQYLATFCSKSDATLRNSSVFGIGILTQKTPFELVSFQTILTWIQVIKIAYNVPKKEKQTKKIYGHCQDNCIAATGKILKRYCHKFDLKFMYDKWLEALPLKFDREQNQIQIQYLCDIIQKEPTLLFDSSPSMLNRLKRVFKVFAELTIDCRKKKLNLAKAKMLFNCKKALLKMSSWNLFMQNQQQIIQSLSANQQSQITDLVSNPELLADFKL